MSAEAKPSPNAAPTAAAAAGAIGCNQGRELVEEFRRQPASGRCGVSPLEWGARDARLGLGKDISPRYKHRNERIRPAAAFLPTKFGPQLANFANQVFRLQAKSVGQKKNRGKAGLALSSLQQRKSRRMKPRAFREGFVRKALFSPKVKQDVSECLGRVQASILMFRLLS